MIEAKGHYEGLFTRWADAPAVIGAQWIEQARNQVRVAGARQVEWYFHEEASADLARQLFSRVAELSRIKIDYLPDPAGVPTPNSRMK